MSQFDAILAGSAGSSRSDRPRICVTETDVVAALRSTRQLTHGASQPSPRSARVPTSTCVTPSVNARVAQSTQRRGCQAVPVAVNRTSASSPASARQSVKLSPAASRNAASRASASCSAQRRPRPETRRGRSALVRPSEESARTASGAVPASRLSTAASDSSGTTEDRSASASTSARSRSPRASYSQPTTSVRAIDFAAECVSSRSTSDAPRRIPCRVSVKPSERSAAPIAS